MKTWSEAKEEMQRHLWMSKLNILGYSIQLLVETREETIERLTEYMELSSDWRMTKGRVH